MEHENSKRKETELPAVPLTLDGSYILHQMFRVRWSAWRALGASDQKHILDRATDHVRGHGRKPSRNPPRSFRCLGHKGDLMVVHFRRTSDDLNDAELRVAPLQIA